MPAFPSRPSALRGIFFMCLAVALMPIMNAIAKALGAEVTLFTRSESKVGEAKKGYPD